MVRPSVDQLRAAAEPAVAAAGYDLEDLTISAAGKRSLVRIVVDRDGGVDLDDVAAISRDISTAFDSSGAAGESPYVLEVSSFGVDRPLTEARHWRRNIGRLVESEAGTGRVLEADDDGVTLDVAGAPTTMTYAEAGPGRVQVEFSKGADVSKPSEREAGP